MSNDKLRCNQRIIKVKSSNEHQFWKHRAIIFISWSHSIQGHVSRDQGQGWPVLSSKMRTASLIFPQRHVRSQLIRCMNNVTEVSHSVARMRHESIDSEFDALSTVMQFGHSNTCTAPVCTPISMKTLAMALRIGTCDSSSCGKWPLGYGKLIGINQVYWIKTGFSCNRHRQTRPRITLISSIAAMTSYLTTAHERSQDTM